MSAEPPPTDARLPLPPEGGLCGCGCAVVFVALSSACAVSNLIHPPADWRFAVAGGCASVLWLALIAFVLVLGVWQTGLSGSVVGLLGMFSRRHFADARPTDDGTVIGFGYQLFGRRFYYLREQITSLDVSTGQATAHAGRDMNDWSVALWYLPEAGPTHGPWPGGRNDEVYIVGPARGRADAIEWLAEVVAFLRAAGVNLEPGEDDTEFRHRRE
jgi:hypothetical protein